MLEDTELEDTELEDAEDVWRRESPSVLGALLRRFGDLAACEDALQEALIEAARRWAEHGVPEHPRGWLIQVASRRRIDAMRQEVARRDREARVAALEPREPAPAAAMTDASLELLARCCHPALSPESQVMLVLRAVLELSTKQIAALFLLPAPTVGQRISRAKATIDGHDRRFPAVGVRDRLPALLQALSVLYTAGHARPIGDELVDVDVTTEAIRLARLLHDACPGEPETAGLLALMLLTESRRAARLSPGGELVTLRDQDRSRWDRARIAEGEALLEHTLPHGPVGAFQLQAAIAAVHADAATWSATDWPQIVELYRMLARVAPSPTVTMNAAVAVGEVEGPAAALALLEPLVTDRRMALGHRLQAVRAPLLEAAGRRDEAVAAYRAASRACTNVVEQRFLNARLAALVAS